MKPLVIAILATTILSHAAVAGAAGSIAPGLWDSDPRGQSTAERRKPRIPGGSGCDSPRDRIRHPECRP